MAQLEQAAARKALLPRSGRILALILTCAPLTAPAQDENQDANQPAGPLEEIVVTATFRQTNVQDTPLAITAINSDMLEARNQTNIVQVSAQAPNVTLKPSGQDSGHAMIAFIRGIGQTDFNYAVEPGVGVYVDDVYYPTLTGSMVDLIDVSRVEILRGPQGTLAGRNSIGGAIKIFSQPPNPEGGGNVSLTFGNYHRVDLRANVSVKLIEDKLYARLSGASRQRDGYVRRLDYRCVHPTSALPTYLVGGDLSGCQVGTEGGQSYTGGRVFLQWLPSDRLTFNIIADAIEDNSESGANVLLRVNDGRNNPNLPGLSLSGQPIGANGADYNGDGLNDGTFYDEDGNYATTNDRVYYSNAFVTYGPYAADPILRDPYVNYSTYLDPVPPLPERPFTPTAVPAISKLHQDGLSLSVDWNITDNLTFRSISAYREYTSDWGDDVDASPLASQQLLQRLEHHHVTQELRLNGQAFNGKVDYTLGGFYVDQDGTLEANVDLYYAQLNFIHGPDPTPSTVRALFGTAIWHLTDALNLELGLRRTHEEKTYTYYRRNPDGTLPQACNGNPNAVTTFPNCVLEGLYNVTGRFTDSRYDWRAAFSWNISDNIMWYTQAATGYKGGGINPRPFFLVQIQSFQPEQLTSYEMGLKTVLARDRLRLNTAVFYNDYTDIQINQTQCELPFPPFFGAPCIQPGNAGNADVKGVEVEAEASIGDKWLIDLSYSNLDFQYTRLQPNVAVTLDMITPYTPKSSWSMGAQFEARLPSGGLLIPRIDAAYQGDIYADPINNVANHIDGYTTANFRLTWQSAQNDWLVALEGTNLTDKLYYTTIFEQYDSSGTVAAAPGIPRMWALSLKHNF